MNLFQLIMGFMLAAVIAVLAWKVNSLSGTGAWAAAITGGLIFGLGGFSWAALLLTFFISSSLLSRAFSQRKAALAEKFSKGSRRDYGQVLANGALGSLLAVGFAIFPHYAWLWVSFAGAMAAVNADTWSTELGVLSPVSPRLITTGVKVEQGTSGGITLLGTAAAMGGAALVALISVLFKPGPAWYASVGIVILAGLVGSLFDSILGATVQAIYWCPSCKKETERHPVHSCGTPTSQVRGWRWVNNDVVNFACSFMGALIAAGLWILLNGW